MPAIMLEVVNEERAHSNASFTSCQVLSPACRRADYLNHLQHWSVWWRKNKKVWAFKVSQLFLTNSSSKFYSASCPLYNCSLPTPLDEGYSQWIYHQRNHLSKFATRADLTSFWSLSRWSKTLLLRTFFS